MSNGTTGGHSLDRLVEIETPEEILNYYPEGVRELSDRGSWDTNCRATTDDSEIALLLARELDELDGYDQETVENGHIG